MGKVKLPTLQKLRKKADHLWSVLILLLGTDSVTGVCLCRVCLEKPAVSAHHIFHKSMHGRFRYDRRNGLPICRKCHFMERRDPAPVVIAAIRYYGYDKWFELQEDVMEMRGKGAIVRNRMRFNNIIAGLEEQIAIEALPEEMRGADLPTG